MAKLSEQGRSELLFRAVLDSGFPLGDDLIHLFVGGSELHGAKLHATDDLDIYGVYVEPPGLILGLERFEHFVWSTAGDERRNGPDDVDVTLYSLQKWAGLAIKGNPTALHFLFAESLHRGSGVWQFVARQRSAFLAKSSLQAFLGFVEAQLGRLQGTRGRGKKGQRPELESVHGYDVKAGMHALRLLFEGKELMERGVITLPRPERDLLVSIRSGQWPLEKVIAKADRLIEESKEAAAASRLPENVDRERISQIVAKAYLQHWKARKLA